MDSSEQMRKAECDYKNLELEKNVKQVEAKVNVLGEASEELHCSSGDLIAKKMMHEKRIKHLEDHQFVLENKLQRNLGSSSVASPLLNKYPIPKFSGHKREIVENVDRCPKIFVKIQGVKTEASSTQAVK